jgi:hypothetical protein
MTEFIKDWWLVILIISFVLWAVKPHDLRWLPHLLESVLVVILLGVFLLIIFWLSANMA